nr:MAG TPA: Putative exonuclease [Caudoviricetes sp.]
MLDDENYYSNKMDLEYFSVSQYKAFMSCEAKAMAKLKGEYESTNKEALLLGSYVHSWSDGTIEQFKKDNPDMYSSRGATKGQLKSSFQIADKMIKTLAEDKVCMNFLTGDKEVIVAGELFGQQWKAKVDVLNLEKGFFSDLKTTQDIYKKYNGLTFIEKYGYIEQMAIYRELIKQQYGKDLMPYIVAVTKEDTPNKAVIRIDKSYTMPKLEEIEFYMGRIAKVKNGLEKPIGCGKCDYCKSVSKVTKILTLEDLR